MNVALMFKKNVMFGSWQEPTEQKTCVLGTLAFITYYQLHTSCSPH